MTGTCLDKSSLWGLIAKYAGNLNIPAFKRNPPGNQCERLFIQRAGPALFRAQNLLLGEIKLPHHDLA